jgi:hypothetical protein
MASPVYSPPPAASPMYSPAPAAVQTPIQVPPAYAQQFGAPYAPYAPPPQAAPPRKRGQMLLIIGIIAVVLIAALGIGGVVANANLSSTYSPQRAVSDYFAAMRKGDVSGMMSNATFLTGDSTYSQYFGRDGLIAMLNADQNKQISDVKVGTPARIDDSTSSVDVSLSWGGTQQSITYQVKKDPSRVHDLFYDSWRVQVPFTTITITLPNQPGAVQVDGTLLPGGSAEKFQAIQGFHKVTMTATFLYDENTQIANGVADTGSVTFPTALSSMAKAAAVDAIKASFNNIKCDPNSTWDCPNHQYSGAYILQGGPGGDITTNTGWKIVFTGDPTVGMKLTVTTTPGEVDAAGVCAMTLTVDGKRTYRFTGTWTSVMTVSGFSFGSHVLEACDSAVA